MSATATNAWVRCLKPNPKAQLRLFCFPYAGGGASIFRAWAEMMPPTVELCAVQLPGRESRLHEPPFDDLSSLVQVLISVLWPYLNQPFAFFGHSMGALISYELARQLSTAQYLTPAHLFVSSRRAPHLPERNPQIHDLPTAEFLAAVRARYNRIPEAVWQNTELMALVQTQLRADFTLLETFNYIDSGPLDCPISAFGGQQDSGVSLEELNAWSHLTGHAFRLHMLPGGHFYLVDDNKPLLVAIAQDLGMHSIL